MLWSRKVSVAPLVLAPGTFDPLRTFHDNFEVAGTVQLDRCPVCNGSNIGRLWQLPQTRLRARTSLSSPGAPYHDYYLDYLPMLTVPQQIFVFDMCADCHSVFRNPKDDDQAGYRNDTSKIELFKTQGTEPFKGIASLCERHFPRNTKMVVNAACGAGQVLDILRERHPKLRLMGLELSQPSVNFMRSRGFEAATVDLDLDDLDPLVPPDSVDFIVFYEAFEHVRSPVVVLKKLVRMLRPGGRMHFSAQYYGPRCELQIRVGEPIYIDQFGLDWVVSQLDATIVDLVVNVKLRVTLQKR